MITLQEKKTRIRSRKQLTFWVISFLLIGLSGDRFLAMGIKRTEFKIQKGINISAWLSQTSITSGPERTDYFTKADLAQLAALGFDHIRLPVSELQLYNDQGDRQEETFKLLHQTIEWCREANMRVIFDCHMTRDHDFSKYSSIVLFKDPQAHERFIKLWLQFSAEFSKYSNELLAYELLNEPAAKENQSWNNIESKLVAAIRKREPERIIILGSNKANNPSTFPDLAIPKNDPNIILSFHFYQPYLITHNQASFLRSIKDVNLPLNYPGQIVSDSVLQTLSDTVKKSIAKHLGVFNKQKLLELMLPAITRAKEEGLRIHCGEFGSNFVYPDHSLQLRWMQDMVSIFKENNIPYTVWGYRKQFGVFDDNRKIKDQQYLDALVK